MSEAEISAKLDEEPEEVLEILPENLPAFNWFLDVGQFWVWSQGFRVALDIQTILKDAEIMGRKVIKQDYVKLKLLGELALEAISKEAKDHE